MIKIIMILLLLSFFSSCVDKSYVKEEIQNHYHKAEKHEHKESNQTNNNANNINKNKNKIQKAAKTSKEIEQSLIDNNNALIALKDHLETIQSLSEQNKKIMEQNKDDIDSKIETINNILTPVNTLSKENANRIKNIENGQKAFIEMVKKESENSVNIAFEIEAEEFYTMITRIIKKEKHQAEDIISLLRSIVLYGIEDQKTNLNNFIGNECIRFGSTEGGYTLNGCRKEYLESDKLKYVSPLSQGEYE